MGIVVRLATRQSKNAKCFLTYSYCATSADETVGATNGTAEEENVGPPGGSLGARPSLIVPAAKRSGCSAAYARATKRASRRSAVSNSDAETGWDAAILRNVHFDFLVPLGNEQIQIQRERFASGKRPVTTPVRIAEFDFVRCAGDELTQLLPLEEHG